MVDTPIVNEALQKDFRDNFPSQISSGRDLHVSDVIVPVVDFSTSTAVTGLQTNLQQAVDFNITSFDVSNTTTTIINNTGFFRVQAIFNAQPLGTSNAALQLTDGSTTKVIIKQHYVHNASGNGIQDQFVDFIVFLKAGISLQATTDTANFSIIGSSRQVADISGTLVNPDGYTGS